MPDKRLIDMNTLPNYKLRVTAGVGEHKMPGEIRIVFWEDIEKAPAIDAVEVVHGRWVFDRPNHYKCSLCDAMWSGMVRFMKFCPDCGMPMDGGAEGV